MNTLYLNEASTIMFLETKLLTEDFSYDSFKDWVVRKIKGYSVAEVDHFAKRLSELKKHEDKIDLINEINEAIKDNDAKLKSINQQSDKEKYNYVKMNIEALNLLKTKANEFSIVPEKEEPDVLKIDRHS